MSRPLAPPELPAASNRACKFLPTAPTVGAMPPCPRCVLSQDTFTLARGTIKSVVEAKVDIRRLRLDPRVVMDIAFAAAGRGHGMTQWLEQTSHTKLCLTCPRMPYPRYTGKAARGTTSPKREVMGWPQGCPFCFRVKRIGCWNFAGYTC